MADHLWRYMTPWLQDDVLTVINSVGSTQKINIMSLFVGIHVRRGDKLEWGEANITSSEVRRN